MTAGKTSSARKPPAGAAPKRQVAAIEPRQFHDDRQAQARARLGLVEPLPAPRHLLALAGVKPGPVVIDDDAHHRHRVAAAVRSAAPRCATRDCAHLQALSTRLPTISSRSCRSPRKLHRPAHLTSIVDVASRWIFSMVRASAVDHRRDIGDACRPPSGARRSARARDGARPGRA